MQIGKVCGSIWATKKSEPLNGTKLLVVQLPHGEKMVATDTIGAGVDDTVLLVFGRPAQEVCGYPTDAAVCGIIDKLDTADYNVNQNLPQRRNINEHQ